MYRYCAIFLFTISLLISCGSPLKTKLENMQPELDTAFYNKYIQKGPDTNYYPVFVHASSQREPFEKYGTIAMMDGKQDTWWSSSNGLNAGEFVSLEFKDLPASTMKIFIANDQVMAKIFTVSVWINDSLAGNFPSGAPINLPKGFKKLKIVAGETDGLNEVKLPVVNDSMGTIQVTKKNIVTRYNSKSFGIAEIEFYTNNGKKLPVRSLPARNAMVSTTDVFALVERFYSFDGDPGTSTQWIHNNSPSAISIVFPDFTPLTKLRIYTDQSDYTNYPETGEIGLQISGKKEQKFALTKGLNEFLLKEPFVARTFTLTIYKFSKEGKVAGINEIQGYDGARWYTIQPDSMYLRADRLRDSLKGTPLQNILNGQISYVYDYTVLNTDTVLIVNPNNIPQEYVDKRVSQKTTVLIRSNYTWQATTSTTTITYGKNVTLTVKEKNMYGDYKIARKSTEEADLKVRYRVNSITTVDGKPGSRQTSVSSGKIVITKTNLSLDGELDMLISY
jgi:hypothetical protein